MHHLCQPPPLVTILNCSTLTRVELHASGCLRRRAHRPAAIAVPSHGSNFMHLSFPSSSSKTISIAVPSHGSNFMHLILMLPANWRSLILQYPHTGRTSCINQDCPQYAAPDLLQYPHTGRTSCIFLTSGGALTKDAIAVPSHGSNFMHRHILPAHW